MVEDGASSSSKAAGAGSHLALRVNQFGMAENLTLAHPSSEDAPGGGGVGGGGAGHGAVLLRAGPVRAADIRRQLSAAGIVSQLFEGVVVTSGGIIIRRSGGGAATGSGAAAGDVDGDAPFLPAGGGGGVGGGITPGFGIEIEGPAVPEYFAVRRALYDLYTLL